MQNDLEIRWLLYQAVRELEYVRCVELPGDHSQCATPVGKELIDSGMKSLGVPDLSAETLEEFVLLSAKGKSLHPPKRNYAPKWFRYFWLFVRIVWREDMSGSRMSWKTASEVSQIVHGERGAEG